MKERIVLSLLPSLYLTLMWAAPWRFVMGLGHLGPFAGTFIGYFVATLIVSALAALASHAWLLFLCLGVFESRKARYAIAMFSFVFISIVNLVMQDIANSQWVDAEGKSHVHTPTSHITVVILLVAHALLLVGLYGERARARGATSMISAEVDPQKSVAPRKTSNVLMERIVFSILPSLYVTFAFQQPWRILSSEWRKYFQTHELVDQLVILVPVTFVVALASHGWLLFINLSVFESRKLRWIIGVLSLVVAIAATTHVMTWYDNYLKTGIPDAFDGAGNFINILLWVIALQLALLLGLLVARVVVAIRGMKKA